MQRQDCQPARGVPNTRDVWQTTTTALSSRFMFQSRHQPLVGGRRAAVSAELFSWGLTDTLCTNGGNHAPAPAARF